MFKSSLKIALLALTAFVMIPLSDGHAEEEVIYFCTGFPNPGEEGNSILVLELKRSELSQKNKKDLKCILPDIKIDTLQTLIKSAPRDLISRSAFSFYSEIEVSGAVLPVEYFKSFSRADDIGFLESRFNSAERVCGFEKVKVNGLLKAAHKNPHCGQYGVNYYGESEGKSVIINCEHDYNHCDVTFYYKTWTVRAELKGDLLIKNWKEYIPVIETKFEEAVLLNYTPFNCVGELCSQLNKNSK